MYFLGFQAGLRPDPHLTVSQWADRHRKLSQRASAEPGQWRTARTPYLREIMDALSPSSPKKEVVFVKASQLGGSECGNNWLGFIIDHTPGPTMTVLPTVELAKRTSKQRIAPLIQESPRLREKVKDSRSRDSNNTMLSKDFPGGTLVLTGANSAVGLRSMPARFLFMDEVDAYPLDVDGEGEPCALAEARTRTFANRKIFKVSTPTFEGRSRIQAAFEETDQRYYHVPCPHCGQYQALQWAGLVWEAGKPEGVQYQCEACGKKIPEHHKTDMLTAGKWVAKFPEKEGDTVGFHLSALYSPVGWLSWREIAKEWEKIRRQKTQDLLRVFINTILGETWKESGEAPDWEKVYNRREAYPLNCPPAEALFLTMGVDVQKDRLELEIKAWAADRQNWSIDYRVLMGDTTQPDVWTKLTEVVGTQFISADNRTMPIQMTAVDSGFNTQYVYGWVRKFTPDRVIAIKGSATSSLMIGAPMAVDISAKKAKRIRRGLQVWTVGVNLIKSELYAALKHDRPGEGEEYPHGYCHYPQYNEDFFKQLTAEKMVKRVVKGFTVYDWVKERERNEALDTHCYNRAAAVHAGLDRLTPAKADAMRAKQATPAKVKATHVTPDPGQPAAPVARKPIKRRESTYL